MAAIDVAKTLRTAQSKTSVKPRDKRVLLATLTIAAFFTSLFGAFVFDDVRTLHRVQQIDSLSPLNSAYLQSGRPLLDWTMNANLRIFGKHVVGYHAVNIVIHMMAGLTLYGLVSRSVQLQTMPARYRRNSQTLGFVVAAVWIVHPLQTQSVTYIVQRCESMMGLCMLLLLYCTLRSDTARKPVYWYVAGFFSLLFGLLSKEVMAMAPLVLLAFDRLLLADSWQTIVHKRKWFYAALCLPFVVGAWMILPNLLSGGSMGFGYQRISPIEYFCSQPGVIVHYLSLSIWPSKLCLDPGWPIATTATEIVLPGLVVLTLLLISIVGGLRGKPWSFLGLAFFLILAPTSTIVPIKDLANEHRMYLPLACVVTMIVLAGFNLCIVISRKLSLDKSTTMQWASALCVMVVAGLAVRTSVRSWDYRSVTTIWESAIRTYPNNPRPYNNLAVALDRMGRTDEAVMAARKGLEVSLPNDPALSRRHNRLASFLAKQGNFAEAEIHFREAMNYAPHVGRNYQNLAVLLAEQDRNSEAEALYRQALAIDHDDSLTQTNLARLLVKTGHTSEAMSLLTKSLESDDQFVLTHRGLAECHLEDGSPQLAIKQLQVALAIDPTSASANHDLAWILATHPDDSIRDGQRAIQIARTICERLAGHRDEGRAWDLLAAGLAEEGRFEEAVAAIENAIDLVSSQASKSHLADLRQRHSMYKRGQAFRQTLEQTAMRNAT